MKRKKEARSSVGALKQAEAGKSAGKPQSRPYYPTNSPPMQGTNVRAGFRIANFLQEGAGNALTAGELAQLLGAKHQRDITKAIERERLAGAPICASNETGRQGYFLASDADEMRRFVLCLTRRISNVSRTLEACMDTLNRMQEGE